MRRARERCARPIATGHSSAVRPILSRLYFAALLPMQDAKFAEQEVYRVAAKGCRVGLIRPIDALGNYPIQPKYGRVWRAMEETGVVYGMHPFPCLGVLKPPGYTEQSSGSELIALTASSSELPHNFLTNVQNFQAEASLWVTLALMSGFFERYPKIRAAVFEASSTWLTFLLDECDKAYELYRNDSRMAPLKRLPSETFFEHCVTGFEGDEAPPSRMPDFTETSWRGRPMSTITTSGGRSKRCASANCRKAIKGSFWVRTRASSIRSTLRQNSFASASPKSSALNGGRVTTK
jgi:hypothetical protein